MFLPCSLVNIQYCGSLHDRELACSASARKGSNFESCVWRAVSHSSHHPHEVLVTQFSLNLHKGGLKPHSSHSSKSQQHDCESVLGPIHINCVKVWVWHIWVTPSRKWNESGFRPPLCTYRLNWAKRTSWGWWDDWDDTVLQTLDSKVELWRSEAEHATSRSRRFPTILTFTRGWGRNIFVSFKPPRPGTKPKLWRERQPC